MGYKFNPFTSNFDIAGSGSSPIMLKNQRYIASDGNDSTGDGSLNKPFLTVGAAEASITDASATNRYRLIIGPGNFDVTGINKKSEIAWAGSGLDVTILSVTSGNFDITNADMAGSTNIFISFQDLSISAPVSADIFSYAGTAHVTYWFTGVSLSNTQTFIGKGGEDAVVYYSTSIGGSPNTWTSVSFFMVGGQVGGGSGSTFNTANSRPSSTFFCGVLALQTVTFSSASDFLIAGFVGSVVNALVVDGAAAGVYVDSGTTISDPTLTSGGQIFLLSSSKRVGYSPSNGSNWNPSPSIVSDAIDQLAIYVNKGNLNGIDINTTISSTDNVAVGGVISATTNTTVDGSNNTVGLQLSSVAKVQAGATNDKVFAGLIATLVRGDGTDDGTISGGQYGAFALMFHNSGASGVTSSVTPFGAALIHQQGTISTIYDFKVDSIPAGGSVGAHYGIYLADSPYGSTKQHWLGGNTKFGAGSFSAPQAVVDANLDITDSPDSEVSVIKANGTLHETANTTVTLYGVKNNLKPLIDSGVTLGGGFLNYQANVDRTDASDLGTASVIAGIYSTFAQTSSAKSTLIYAGYLTGTHTIDSLGTVGAVYDFAALASSIDAGVVTDRFGIYIEPDTNYTKQNWISGNVKVGGSSYTSPTESLCVDGNLNLNSATANTVAVFDSSKNLVSSSVLSSELPAQTDAGEQNLGTLTWSSTIDPSGSINKKYRWVRVGNVVHMWSKIDASIAGTLVTAVQFPLPGDMPTPNTFSSQANNTIVAVGTGSVAASALPSVAVAEGSKLFPDGSSVYQVKIETTAALSANNAWSYLSYAV